jgi:BatD DUF11 like domain
LKNCKTISFLSAFIWVALSFCAAAIHAATFTATLDRDTITLGESATLSLIFEGDSPKKVPVPPDVPGLQISYLGPSSQFSFINGQTKSTVTHNFTITPQRAGEFVIPPMTADVGGQQLTSPTLKLTVLEPNAPTTADMNSGSQVAFLTFTLPQQKFYVGQVVTGVLKIYLRNDVENANNLQLTGIPADGFTVGKLIQGSSEHTQIGNHVYTIIPFSVALTVIKTGTVSIGPVTAGGVLLVAAPGQQGDSFFQQFGIRDPFGNMGGARKQVSLATDALTADALPIPTQNAPANFNGAVGNYTMTVTAGPTNVAVGDPITVRVQISGSGDLAALTLPDQPAWHDFKTFQPTSKVDYTDQLGIQGTKTFEQIVTPQNTDVRELPEFSFSFFNPDTETFQTLTQPAVQLAVHSGGSVVAPTIAGTKSSPEAPPPATILPIKQNLGALAQITSPLVTRPWFLAVQSLPVLAWLAAFVWRKRTDNLANNPRLRRQRRVAQLVQSGLNELRRFAAENNSEEFFSTLFHLLQEQLGERLDCPAFSITEEVVEEKLRPRDVSDSTINALHELFQICNQARYAPIRDSRELNAIVTQFENIARELQNLKP